MLNAFLSTVNYWAVIVSGAAYWIAGSIWFSVLFGTIWGSELEKHGVKIKEPTKQELMMKLVQTFVLNLVVAFGVSFLLFAAHPSSLFSGIKVGLYTGIFFSAATTGIAYTWESRSLKLFLVDAGYPVVGITLCSLILTLLR